MIRAAICLLAIPLLAACGEEPVEAPVVGEDSRSASGDVLPSSINDDMVPLDSLESTSPAARETASATAPRSEAPTAAAQPTEAVEAEEPAQPEAAPAPAEAADEPAE